MRNYILRNWFNLLVTLKLKKPFKTYMGRPVTDFKFDFNSFLDQYIQIQYKSSGLSYSRRKFVETEVEKWLKENKIPVSQFKKKILSNNIENV